MFQRLISYFRYDFPKNFSAPGSDEGTLTAIVVSFLPMVISFTLLYILSQYELIMVIGIILVHSAPLIYHIIFINLADLDVETNKIYSSIILLNVSGTILITINIFINFSIWKVPILILGLFQNLTFISAPFLYSKFSEDRIENKLTEGDRAPSFHLKNVEGEEFTLEDQIKNNKRTVLLFVKGTWCPFCVRKLRSFNSFYADIKEYNATVFAITPDKAEEKIQRFATKHDLGFQFIHDPDRNVSREYGIIDLATLDRDPEVALPATILIDEEGVIQWYYVADFALPSRLIAELKRLEIN